MSDIEPHELSAYLDGELSADRRRAVAAALASDPMLRAEVEALAGADATWRKTAQAAAFTPSIRWPRKSFGHVSAPVAVLLAVVLVALKLVPKFADSAGPGLIAHTLALAIALAGIAWLAVAPMRKIE
jgi:anti-sigma factor RsiW